MERALTTPAATWRAVTILLAGAILPPVDFFIVNVTLSSIHAGLGASAASLQLVISGYAACYAVFLITGGRLGDLYGRKRMFLLGMAGFTLALVLCGTAASAAALLVGRGIQGVAAAMLAPQVLGAIRSLCPNDKDLARALSAYGVMMGLAAVTGQFMGGALVQWSPFDLGWRTVYLLQVPLCLTIIALAWWVVPETGGQGSAKLDLPGAGLSSLALACLIVPLSEGRERHWPLWVFVTLAAAPCMMALFLRHEQKLLRQGGQPLIDLSLFAIPSFRRGVLVAMLFFFTTSFYFLFGLYQQEGRGLDPLHVGLAIVPYGFGLFAGPLVSAPWVRPRPRLLAIGMSIQITGYAAIGALVAWGSTGVLLTGAVLLAGFGQGIAFPRLYNTVLGDVPAASGGVASGIVNSALQVGGSISAAAIGGLFFATLGSGQSERAYAHAFALAQFTLTAALFVAMVLAIPRRAR